MSDNSCEKCGEVPCTDECNCENCREGQGISKKILEVLKEIVKDPVEYKMIVQLLKKEKRFGTKQDTRLIKKEFQLSINQHFPMEENNE